MAYNYRDIDLRPLKPHLARSILSDARLNVWEGAVRSSKTMASIFAFLDFIEHDTHFDYEMSGYTMSSLINNVVDCEYGIMNLVPGSDIVSGGKNKGTILKIPTSRGIVRCHLFGAPNKRSQDAVRGLTSYGWYADEVNRQDKDFIHQSFNRMLQVCGGHTFWTLNPGNPYDTIYSEYIDKWRFETPENRIAFGGYNYYHCTFEDNPILTADDITKIKMGYVPGSYEYKRDVLGLRAIADGLVYPAVEINNVFKRLNQEEYDIRYCSVDYGACHPNVIHWGGPRKDNKNKWAIIHELYDTFTDRSTSTIVDNFEQECIKLNVDANRMMIAIDPSARGLFNEFYNRGFRAIYAQNDVLPGITTTKKFMYRNILEIDDRCVNTRREMGSYAWDAKAAEIGLEKPIKMNDDCDDSVRYFAYTHMKDAVRV